MTKTTNPPQTSPSLPSPTSSKGQLFRFGKLRQLTRDERGLSTVEYVILLVMIVAGAVGIWKDIGTKVTEELGGARDEIENIEQSTPK